MELGDKFRLVLATTLREDGFPDTGKKHMSILSLYIDTCYIKQEKMCN